MFENFLEINIDYKDLEDVTFEKSQIFLVINIDEVPFEFLLNIKNNSDRAIVFGSGAYNPAKINPPIFNRFSWKDDFDCTTIWYNDPTLYNGKINLGWGYGTEDRFYLKEISNILSILLNKLNIPNLKTLFFGSSGGGFTSIALSSMTKGSKAFVNNPQTIIENYFKTHVDKLKEVVKNRDTHLLKRRSNLVEIFKQENHVPEILYIQNIACKHDMNNHLLPFMSDLNNVNPKLMREKINIELYSNEEEGHTPMNNKDTIEIITRIIKSM